LEHRIYSGIARIFRGKTVSKGHNALKQASILHKKFSKFTDPVAIGLDASRFDQHVGVDALRFEHSIYKEMFKGLDRKQLAALLKAQIKNKIVFFCRDGMIKLKVLGRRMSGDMNTALGNCLLMCAMVWSYLEERGITAELYNNGDDCVVIMERLHVDKFTNGLAEWFLEMGFTMKVEPTVDVFEQIEFCKTKPVWNGSEYVMVRKFPDAIDKDSISLLPINDDKAIRNWFHDTGDCGQALSSGVPIFQDFYQMLSRWGEGARGFNLDQSLDSGMQILARGMKAQTRVISEQSRFSFYLAFGVTPDEQRDFESKYQNLQRPNTMESFVHDSLYDFDLRVQPWVAPH
jgi:hypothetical protein